MSKRKEIMRLKTKILSAVTMAVMVLYMFVPLSWPLASASSQHVTPIVTTRTVIHEKPLFVVPSQWQTSGPGVAYPGVNDPTRKLPISVQTTFACIRYHESRNHVVDGAGSQGWYQFTQSIWDSARAAMPHLPSTPNQATGNQQSLVAVWYFERNGRFGVEWGAEAKECPGTFYFSVSS